MINIRNKFESLFHFIGCGANYASSWCQPIQGAQGQSYYGRGWFQLSWPCNYYAAGQSMGLDLLNNPNWVSDRQDVAVKTAIWFYQTNKMEGPARKGDFAATTRIINGKLECNGGSGAANQAGRVETYKRIRICFGLGAPKINPTC
jgi:predicted chitinase